MSVVGTPIGNQLPTPVKDLLSCQLWVKDYLNRTDIDTQIYDAINATIRRLERKFNFKYMVSRDPNGVVLEQGQYTLTLPSGLKEIISVHWVDTNGLKRIKRKDESEVIAMYPDMVNHTGTPKIYAIKEDAGQMLIRPTADIDYTFYRKYRVFSGALSIGGDTTHWILDNFPEVIQYGACLELMPLIKDFERETIWRGKFNEALFDLKKQDNSMSDGSDFIEGSYASN